MNLRIRCSCSALQCYQRQPFFSPGCLDLTVLYRLGATSNCLMLQESKHFSWEDPHLITSYIFGKQYEYASENCLFGLLGVGEIPLHSVTLLCWSLIDSGLLFVFNLRIKVSLRLRLSCCVDIYPWAQYSMLFFNFYSGGTVIIQSTLISFCLMLFYKTKCNYVLK